MKGGEMNMSTNGIVNIHGKEYMTVARRVELAHEAKVIESLDTQVIATDDNHVVIKAVIVIKGVPYSGISSVAMDSSRQIEKSNPYEVAETSAVGRALGFAGFGIIEGIASADEMAKSQNTTVTREREDGYTAEVMEEIAVPEHTCTVHHTLMKERTTKAGATYYDHRRQTDGEWERCNGTGFKTQAN